MRISVDKLGTVLVSRPAGKEAYLAIQPMLKNMNNAHESIELDFAGVMVLTPSWIDEFLTPLKIQFPERVLLINTENPSVSASLETLRKAALASSK